MKPDCKEIERQLAESRREFWAADATINNLEKLAEMAAQLANAEDKCASMAAENEAINFYLRNGPVIRKGGEIVAAHQFSPETPSTDAFLAEVRAQGVDMARNAMIDFVDGEVGPNKNVPGLIRGAEICVSIADQLRKGGNQ